MTQEAYVSFETAKLLKEKGFDWRTQYVYTEDGTGFTPPRMGKWKAKSNIPMATHQMACSWLREECEVYIDIETCYEYTNRNENFKVTGFAFTTHTKDDPCYDDDNSFDSYEEACEAALKHVLENLI